MAIVPKQAGAAMNENMMASMQNFGMASKAMQAMTNEMMAMSMASMQQTARVFEQMQGARSLSDIMRIQADFFRTSFEEFAARSRRIAELATTAPVGVTQKAVATARKVGEQATEATKTVVEDAKAATVGLDGLEPPKT